MQSFFTLAAVSPSRQRSFRLLVCAHVGMLATLAFGITRYQHIPDVAVVLGSLLLIAGIVEGALLVGWRLTQLPKSQALEFLLVSPLRPPWVLMSEAAVGFALLAKATLAGLPVLVLLAVEGDLILTDLIALLVMPWIWGTVTGLGFAAWAFEPAGVRRWGERAMFALVLLYLIVGVLAGEHLRDWLACFSGDASGGWVVALVSAWHEYNPFAVMKHGMEQDPEIAWPRLVGCEVTGLLIAGLLLARTACRLHGHFQDRHYAPAVDTLQGKRTPVSQRPLAWWAVRRVMEYSGRINLWLAGGFAVLYAAYILAGPHWPPWLGQQVFVVFDNGGGVPVLATVLVLLASVPAAFQYGLWDSNAADRARRLELLLLTQLEAKDYWEAALAAAWRRGRGYFAIALLLWLVGVFAGKMDLAQMLVAAAAAVVLWGLYFAIGFRAFARGLQASSLGLMLTVGLPLAALVAYQGEWRELAVLLPPASVYQPANGPPLSWLPGPLLGGTVALMLTRFSLRHGDRELRRWYDAHHGNRAA
jgi:hypothetical protein